ncbi:MAG: DUF1080 domain-containing protein [Armatimonadetes bacterium]|nr:DUF1080 domain-containing protein [Armatimonadota bacterium]
MTRSILQRAALIGLAIALAGQFRAGASPAQRGDGFVDLFNGRNLDGWVLLGKAGPGYVVENGVLVAPADGGGNLYTDRDYSDFVLRFEFRLDKAGNNGVGIRAPLGGDAAYDGMEVQILDDYDPMYANLQPAQYCGSIYRVAAVKRGATKKAGEWNSEEISAIGRRVRVKINGKTVVDADLNKITDRSVLLEHPGMLRSTGRIGFLGHGPSRVEFRNIRIRDLGRPERDNVAPPGFRALFNGRDLTGWKALVGDPPARAKMPPEALAEAQRKADVEMRKHWQAVDGAIVYDGKNNSLCTAKDYADFEMLVDWKIPPGGDSGIYLRGSPQIQIWDRPEGSGALYNNEKNPRTPTKNADRAPGFWNRFRIMMVGDKVTVFLNDALVVRGVTMENYWERNKPIYPSGQIELQHHGSQLFFKNIYIREIPAAP